MNTPTRFLAAALLATVMPWLAAPAAAAPMSPLGLRNAVAPSVETVQYRRWRGGYRRFGGAAIVPGIAGAIIGGAILGATQPYGYGPYGYGPYGYGGYGPGYVVVPPYAGGSEVAYCRQRFRSYDPVSGTYLGLDGLRHPCP